MKKQQVVILCVVLLVGLAVLRLRSGDEPAGIEVRNAMRVMVCRNCQALEVATAETIRQRYDEERVGTGYGGVLFGCASCGEITAKVVEVDLGSRNLGCPDCGWKGPTKAADAQDLIESEKAKGTAKGQLMFHCPSCKAFTATLSPPLPPEGEEEEI